MVINSQIRQLERDLSQVEHHEWAEEVKELFLIGKWFYLTWERPEKIAEWSRVCFYTFRHFLTESEQARWSYLGNTPRDDVISDIMIKIASEAKPIIGFRVSSSPMV